MKRTIFALLSLFLVAPTFAGSMKERFFIPLTVNYAEKIGGAGGVGYQFPNGMMLLGQVTYTQFEGTSGEVSKRIGCTTYRIPYHVPDSGAVGAAFTLVIPIQGKRNVRWHDNYLQTKAH